MHPDNKHLPIAALRERYGVSDRTVDRWIRKHDLEFPQPVMINGRRYWSLAALAAWDAARLAA